jgi:hypothetical protein
VLYVHAQVLASLFSDTIGGEISSLDCARLCNGCVMQGVVDFVDNVLHAIDGKGGMNIVSFG